MIDLEQLSSWLVVVLFFLGISILLTRRPRQGLADRLERLAAWSARRARSDPEFDDDPAYNAEMREILRDEKLRADLDRLQHLLATDEHMSATRQLGNRLAYEKLLEQMASRRSDLLAPVASAQPVTSDAMVGREVHGPESLDLRWR